LTQLVLRLLGGFGIQDAAGAEIRVASRKGRALLAYLAVRAGESQTRDRLASLLWEEADEELARTSLRQALAAIRKCLPESAHAALIADTDSLRVDPNLVTTDILELNRALTLGTRTSLQDAIALHRGDLLEGLDARSTAYEEWLSQERQSLRRRIADASQKLGALCAAQDDVDGALAACARFVSLEPLNEAAHRTLMELHARRNAYADALRQYQICRDILRRELDVAPEPATEQLYRDLMRRRRAAAAASGGNGAEAEVEGSTPVAPTAAAPKDLPPNLRDAVVLVARLDGLLELEATLDPEEAHALSTEFQSQVRRVVDQYGGCTDRRVGATVLAVFGAAEVRGNEAERAVRAALLLQQSVTDGSWKLSRDLRLRVGVAQGQILVDRDLFPLTGRPTHAAHALAADAANEGVCVADEVRNALAGRINGKALSAGANAWSVQGFRSETAADGQQFVGRRPELAMLLTVLERCRTSQRGRAIVIRGDAGIGKTSMVNAIRAAALQAGIRTHSSVTLDFGQSLGHRPVTTLALSLLDVSPGAPLSERSDAVARKLASSQAGIDRRIFLSDLIDAPLSAELSALENAMDTATRQRGRSLALSELIESAAQRAPLLLVIEDVHWADPEELARFGEIAAVVAQCPALLLMTTRPEGDPIGASWRARARGCPVTTIDLAPLGDDEAQELAALYPELPATAVEACIRRAEGNPLFLDQLLRAARTGLESLPGSIRTLVVARANGLASRDRQALECAAVLGHRFALTALRQLVDDDYDAAPIVDTGLLHANDAELEFAHALFRDSVYESTLRSRRRDLHRKAAAWFASHDLTLQADHLAAAEDPAAAAAYLDAARAEQTALRFERALVLVNKANAAARDPVVLNQINCLMGELSLVLGRTHDALTAYREAIDFAPAPRGQGEAGFGVASVLRIMDRYHEAIAALEHAQKAWGELADARTKARMMTLYGNLCFPIGRLEACLDAHEEALRHATQANSPIDLARAYGGLGDAWYQRGRMHTARDYFGRCIEAGQTHNLPGVRIANLPMLAVTSMYCGDLQSADIHLRQGLELARNASDARSEMLVQLVMASSMLMRGQFETSAEHARQGNILSTQLGARRFQAEALCLLGSSSLQRGAREEALPYITEGLELARLTGMNYCGPVLLGILARITQHEEEREIALEEAESLLAEGCVSHSYFEFYHHAIEVRLRDGNWVDAYRYADALAEYTRAEPLAWTELVIRRGKTLADIGAGRITPDTIRSLQELDATCRRLNLYLELPAIDAALAKVAALQA
jgi:DNA-binding SARP family transcriptional activator